nr:MAG TPA: hypothetical protein [Caudoviricetes sp.]
MVYHCFGEDKLNHNNKRNLRNTPKLIYNCGGYALGCFSWYCPRETDVFYYGFDSHEEAREKTDYCVKCMLADFPTLRVIASLDEVAPDEYPILFRLSHDGDFHYLKRADNGIWYNKMGSCSMIEIMPKDRIFNIWYKRYDGPIIIFAKKKIAVDK